MNVDVCVTGGGPSGAITAIELTRLGFRVGLLHQCDAQVHWPETITPRLSALLAQVGLADVASAALSARVAWKWLRWNGEDSGQLRPSDALIIDRGRFDPMLRTRAADAGVEITDCRAGRPVMSPEGTWRIPIQQGGVARAKFVVIAGGRRSLPRIRDGRRMVAFYGIASGVSVASRTMLVGSTRHSWYWGASMRDGTLQLLVFKEGCGPSKQPPMVLLREALQSAAPHDDCAALAFVRATDATARSCANAAGSNWIRTGDALLTVDPLNGAGLYAAVLSAVQAARVVNTIMRRPEQTSAALVFYAAMQSDIRRHCANMASEFYNAGMRTGAAAAPNAQRATDYASLYLASEFRLVPVPALVGDYVSERLGIPSEGRRPIAFVEGQPIAALLAPLCAGKSLAEVAGSWSRLSLASRASLMHLLMEERIVVPATDSWGRDRRAASVTRGLVAGSGADHDGS